MRLHPCCLCLKGHACTYNTLLKAEHRDTKILLGTFKAAFCHVHSFKSLVLLTCELFHLKANHFTGILVLCPVHLCFDLGLLRLLNALCSMEKRNTDQNSRMDGTSELILNPLNELGLLMR